MTTKAISIKGTGCKSEYSYGVRPGPSAHDAVEAAQKYIAAGYRWVVDLDLEKFSTG